MCELISEGRIDSVERTVGLKMFVFWHFYFRCVELNDSAVYTGGGNPFVFVLHLEYVKNQTFFFTTINKSCETNKTQHFMTDYILSCVYKIEQWNKKVIAENILARQTI